MGNTPYENSMINRRTFVARAGAMMTLATVGINSDAGASHSTIKSKATIRVRKVNSDFEREPLYPYRFKGSVVTSLWQTAAWMESESGIHKTGIGVQSPLWSDGNVFSANSVSAGNALMYAMTERALQMIKGNSFSDPHQLLDELLPEVWEYGKKITNNPNLRKTFALNSLVCVDNAAWLLYAAENKITKFDDMIPSSDRPGLSYRHTKVASMPSFSVGADIKKIKAAADEGYFMLKLKIGSAGTQKEMLEKDIQFLTAVHNTIGHYETPYTKSGKIPYYFDANERYDEKETLQRFLDHAKKIGAFDQIAVIEEPLGERNDTYVGDLGVTIAADESAHTTEEAGQRIEQGYKAIAVKAVAKTLSMTMRITTLAYEKKIPCFCADLTVNPILVDWNKNIAARLAPFPNISVGLQETNGHQYYKNWDTLVAYHSRKDATWIRDQKGVYITDQSFYDESGGILFPSQHYEELFKDDL